MKFYQLSFLLLLLWNASCQNAPKTAGTQAPEPMAGIRFIYQDLGTDASDIPHSVLLLSENGGTTLLDTLSLSLAKIEKEKYAEMGIPPEAIDACGGWFAGGGDYFYVVDRNGKAVVYRGYQEEQDTEKGYHWTAFKAK